MKRSILAALLLGRTALAAQAQTDVWNDIRKPWRSNAEMQSAVKADSIACNREAGVQRGPLTRAYKDCMLRHNWKFSHAVRTKSRPVVEDNDSPPVDNSSDDTFRRIQDQNNTQQMLNTQQMINDQQMQNDQLFNQNQNQMMNNQ